jgi:hypothetical protein
MKPIVKTLNTLSDDDNGVCASQTPAAGGEQSLSLDGALVSDGVATMAEAQIITMTPAADESARTFTYTGTDADGITITESITGAAVAVATTGYFKTITGITVDDDTAGAIIIGPVAANGAVTKSIRVNRNQTSSFKLGLYVELTSATLTYTVQHSADWPENGDFTAGYSNAANWYATDGLTALDVTDESNIVLPVECVRLQLTAYTSGTSKLTVQQNY